MENNGYKGEEDVKMEKCKETVVYMCGYLPGISPDKSPILSPIPVRLHGDDAWKDVCGGGCGFAIAISSKQISARVNFSGSNSLLKFDRVIQLIRFYLLHMLKFSFFLMFSLL